MSKELFMNPTGRMLMDHKCNKKSRLTLTTQQNSAKGSRLKTEKLNMGNSLGNRKSNRKNK